MKTPILSTLFFMVIWVSAIGAQEPVPPATPSTDALFEKIMGSLGADMRERIDSATAQTSPQRIDQPETTVPSGSGSDAARKTAEREAALRELPDAVRRQVEQAIVDMERGTQQRAMEMKERRKGP